MMRGMAHAALECVRLLSRGLRVFTERALRGLQANRQSCESAVEKSLALVTSLNPIIGYQQAAAIAKEAFQTGKTIREVCLAKGVLSPEQLAEALDPRRMLNPQ